MTQRAPNTRQRPHPKKLLIAEELDRLREKSPRATNREPLSQLERLAVLNGLRDGVSTSRIATQGSMSGKTVERLKSKLYDEPLSILLCCGWSGHHFDFTIVTPYLAHLRLRRL